LIKESSWKSETVVTERKLLWKMRIYEERGKTKKRKWLDDKNQKEKKTKKRKFCTNFKVVKVFVKVAKVFSSIKTMNCLILSDKAVNDRNSRVDLFHYKPKQIKKMCSEFIFLQMLAWNICIVSIVL